MTSSLEERLEFWKTRAEKTESRGEEERKKTREMVPRLTGRRRRGIRSRREESIAR